MSRHHRITSTLIGIGVACFVAFHFLDPGWRLWPLAIETLKIPEYLRGAEIGIAGLFLLPLPVLGAPICAIWPQRSRALQRILAASALVAAAMISSFLVKEPELQLTLLLLPVSAGFTLAGLLLIKPCPPPGTSGK